MELIEQLRAEHTLIDDVVGSLVQAVADGEGAIPAADLPDFVRFFRIFAGDFHHQGEEKILFPALVAKAEVPGDRGPMVILAADHEKTTVLVNELEASGGSQATVSVLVEFLWEHIDKENSVLLPEAVSRLERGGVRYLAGRQPTPEQEQAKEAGERLVKRYPPADDPAVIRGDGCVLCSAFGTLCAGIEKEWWNTWEWDHFQGMDDG